MLGRSILALILVFGSVAQTPSQDIQAPSAGEDVQANLELILQAKDIHDGMPASLVLVLRNISDHDVHVPARSSVNCGDTFDGSFWLDLKFTPVPAGRPANSGGCGGSVLRWPPILERVQQWKVLHPGQSLTTNITADQAFRGEKRTGTYQVWTHFRPPHLSSQDKNDLQHAGIDFPRAELTTGPTTFFKQ